MRDSIGGTFMLYIFIIFLVLYITFVAVALNYAKAFKVKNKVIDIIEQNEGIRKFEDTSGEIGQIDSFLDSIPYYVALSNNEINKYGTDSKGQGGCFERGYCIVKNQFGNSEYYKVTTFVRIEFPFFRLGFTIPIKGETRKIERINT